MYHFFILDNKAIPWHEIQSSFDHTIYKSKAWFDFLKNAKNAVPFIIRIEKENQTIGYLPAIRIKKLGVKIIASPFEGYTTFFQGLSMLVPFTPEEKIQVYKALYQYLFKRRMCWFFQASDFFMQPDQLGFEKSIIKRQAWVIDLTQDIDAIYSSFRKSCRYLIRKSSKLGVTISQPSNLNEFADNYFSQLNDVFKKQNLRPTYNKKRVVELIKAVYPTGNLLLLEARNKEGICIATGIYPGSNKLANAWGSASYSNFQHLSPNEALRFEAIKYWKAKGFEKFEMGGGGDYKLKFKPQEYFYVQIVASKFELLTKGKAFFKKAYYKTRKLIAPFGL